MAANSPGTPADSLPVPLAGAVNEACPPSGPSSEQQTQGILSHKLLAYWTRRSKARPYLIGAALGPVSLYALKAFQGGTIWGLFGLPDIPLAELGALGAFAGSVVFGGVANIVGTLWNALGVPHRWRLGELWFTYWLGRISPKQYFELGAALDYQRHCGYLPPDARPRAQAEFVAEAVRWRMDSKKKRRARRKGSRKSQTPQRSEGRPFG